MKVEKTVDSSRVIYTPSEFARVNLLYLQEIGNLSALKEHSSSRSKLSSYLFFIVEDGKGELNYLGQNYSLNKGDCVFIDCYNGYAHSTSIDLWKIKWVHFNGASMDGIYNKYSTRGGQPTFHIDNLNDISNILGNLFNTATTDDYIRDMKINTILSSLLTFIMEQSWNPLKKAKKRLGNSQSFSLQDVKEYIDINFQKNITLDKLSSIFYVNKFHLERLFKKQYGRSIIAYINERRITYSKTLLRFTNDNIEKIAQDSGFIDHNYYSRKFKSLEGMSPKEYRNKWSNAK